jgi:CRP/FNR family transcriptional regulator
VNSAIVEILETYFPFFQEEELIAAIATEGKVAEVPRGQVLMEIGSYIKTIPLVVTGTIKIVREDNEGNELLMYYLAGGSSCAMSMTCCMQAKTSEIRAVAEDDCLIISIPVNYMDKWTAQFASWRNFTMQTYHQRFDELLQTIDSIAFMNLDERLLKYLKDKTMSLGTQILDTTHKEVAFDLNSSREVISRLLKLLESRGLVRLGRNKIELIEA